MKARPRALAFRDYKPSLDVNRRLLFFRGRLALLTWSSCIFSIRKYSGADTIWRLCSALTRKKTVLREMRGILEVEVCIYRDIAVWQLPVVHVLERERQLDKPIHDLNLAEHSLFKPRLAYEDGNISEWHNVCACVCSIRSKQMHPKILVARKYASCYWNILSSCRLESLLQVAGVAVLEDQKHVFAAKSANNRAHSVQTCCWQTQSRC